MTEQQPGLRSTAVRPRNKFNAEYIPPAYRVLLSEDSIADFSACQFPSERRQLFFFFCFFVSDTCNEEKRLLYKRTRDRN